MGTERELFLEVTPAGLLTSDHPILERRIDLKPVCATMHVLDLSEYESPAQGQLRLTLRFAERVWGTHQWVTTIESFAIVGESKVDPLTIFTFDRWKPDGLQYQLDLRAAAEGAYRFRLEPLGIEQDFNVLPGELTDVTIDAPPLAILEIDVRWSSDREFVRLGNVGPDVTYYVLMPGGEMVSGRAELYSGKESLYRVSALPGMQLSLQANYHSLWRADLVKYRCMPRLQRVELNLQLREENVLKLQRRRDE